jgi:hypothetical protein
VTPLGSSKSGASSAYGSSPSIADRLLTGPFSHSAECLCHGSRQFSDGPSGSPVEFLACVRS